MDTYLLSKISKVLNHNFFTHYFADEIILEVAEPMADYKTGKEESMIALKQEVETLRKELADMKDKQELLKKINVLLEQGKQRK